MKAHLPLEDYALIGDTESAALVGKNGSIDWLCLPRFDSPACLAALLGDADNGHWRIAPRATASPRRRYRGGTLVLETEFDGPDGSIRVVDFMPPRAGAAHVVRLVEGLRGRVRVDMDLRLRFDYGRVRPWLRRVDDVWTAVGGPDSVVLRTRADVRAEAGVLRAEFTVGAGELVPFVLSWTPSHEPMPKPIDALVALDDTESRWSAWLASCTYDGEWREPVVRSLLTLKALTYAPTGGIVAAPTTSLPERIRGIRNWDYRYCWLRDASLTLLAFTRAGFRDEAAAWHRWLLRSAAGDPSDLQIVYGVGGERRLPELELPWLSGYCDSKPVRVGNAAAGQFQLDVYGEVVNALHEARRAGLDGNGEMWALTHALVEFVESNWERPDEGLWEVRGPRRHFTNSKVMAWVALDRAITDAAEHGLAAPLERWRARRGRIHEDVLAHGYDPQLGAFTQSYGSPVLDASALLYPLVGFVPASDPRMRSTVAAVERELVRDGLVYRYLDTGVDGLPRGEGAFLACSFWLVGNYAYAGRLEEARALFEHLLSLSNDVGLLAEEYDPVSGRQLGNFPQAFSHVPLVMAAFALEAADGR